MTSNVYDDPVDREGVAARAGGEPLWFHVSLKTIMIILCQLPFLCVVCSAGLCAEVPGRDRVRPSGCNTAAQKPPVHVTIQQT